MAKAKDLTRKQNHLMVTPQSKMGKEEESKQVDLIWNFLTITKRNYFNRYENYTMNVG
jgi:hypothetical protein